MIVTIDGPSGAGKGSAAKALAKRLGFSYVDTGAIYRALSYLSLREGVDPREEKEVIALLDHFDFRTEIQGGKRHYYLDQEEITAVIRTPAVTERVSAVSAIEEVRTRLLPLQRKEAELGNVVFEGRDMGTTLFPHADVKIFLTASPEVRAHRRYLELAPKHPHLTEASVLADQLRRDEWDSTRSASPLRAAEDAIYLDTSALTLEEVVDRLVEIVRGKHG
ncbi:MAG: (d)CMP kinase [Verrucomicrobia bacterium]|nr:(d)CMP kinase [Verrucomicrobiota bacterium]